MLKKILIALAAIIVVFLGVVAMQPADFRYVRTATISAPASAVFAEINDFHKWAAWSPWEKLDPAMQKSFEGAAFGNGASYSWVGNSEVGKGRMTITESRPHDLIRLKLDFIEPFETTNTTEFTLMPEGDKTAVTWSMSGKNNFISKAFCLFVDMDKMLGSDFEKGLAQMKTVVEATPKRDLTFTRRFDAPLESVWKAWTEAEQVKRWWGPTGFTCPLANMDVREGGTSLVCMSAPGYGDLYSTWQYQAIAPMERIEYIHNLADKDGNKIDPAKMGMPPDFPQDQRHAVTFKTVDGKTELTITEYNWAVGQMMEMSKMGMEQCLDKMAVALASH